jgi:hypothetical protein
MGTELESLNFQEWQQFLAYMDDCISQGPQ